MADGFSDADLQRLNIKFNELQKDMRNRFTRKALRRGANVIRNAVKRRAAALDDPETGESIAKNVSVQSSRRLSRPGQIGFRVGIRGGAKKRDNVNNPGGDTWYWRFLEFGRGPVVAGSRKKGLANRATGEFFGARVGPATPRPFMRPAMAESIEPAIAAVTTSLNDDIDKFLRGGL